jgi:hypothetical protein
MTPLNSRRQFILSAPVFGTVLLAACSPPAPPPPAPTPAPVTPPAAAPVPEMPASTAGAVPQMPRVDEQSPQAQTLAYVADASRVDKTKHANFVAGSQCSNCALYQGAAGSAEGPCAIFGGQRVAAAGWCSTWAKKA